jgi:hypothetical protein
VEFYNICTGIWLSTYNTIVSTYEKQKWEASLIEVENVKQEQNQEEVEIGTRNMRQKTKTPF